MIPIHDLKNKERKGVRIEKLGAKTHYDFGQPHRHNYLELFVFEKGGGEHEIDFVNLPISSNSIHIVTAGREHHVRRAPDSEGFVVLFEGDVFEKNSLVANFLFNQSLYDVTEYEPVFHFDGSLKNQVSQMIEMMWEDYNSEEPLKQDYILGNLNSIILLCIRSQGFVESPDMADHQPYIGFRKLLQKEFRRLRKVKEYAAALNISEKKLNEIVTKKTGQSCSTIIYRQVILEAKRLLNASSSSKEVAYALNFDDPGHFSKFFKNQTGISPSQFQKVQA